MTTIATFNDISKANAAVDSLMHRGVPRDKVSIVTLEENRGKLDDPSMVKKDGIAETAGDTAAGVLSGTTLGGIIGFLTGVAALTIPGLGPLLITGPLAVALGGSALAANTAAGAAIGGAAGGISSLASSLTKAGVDAAKAEEMQNTVQSGGVIIAVDGDDNGALNSAGPDQIVTLP